MAPEGYIRVAAAAPRVRVADVDCNVEKIKELSILAAGKNADIVVFPELSLTGYTCGDLFRQPTLLSKALEGLKEIAFTSGIYEIVIVVGLPLMHKGKLYNCAAICNCGGIDAIIPKTYIPNHNEFYEKRWFSSGEGTDFEKIKLLDVYEPYFGNKILLEKYGAIFSVEICEDMWMPETPGTKGALAGANVILNLSATNEVIGKHEYLLDLIRLQSAKNISGYVYASAGAGESSTDLVFAGNAIIAENGVILEQSPRFSEEGLLSVADIDISFLNAERINSSMADQIKNCSDYHIISKCGSPRPDIDEFMRRIDPHPFVPADNEKLDERCREIISIQTAGLVQRLRHTGCKHLVVGISGGLDSTLALLVAVKAFDTLGIDRKGITGITMPGLGTSGRTRTNAHTIMEELGISIIEIPIVKAVEQHFEDIGHDRNVFDVTYENSQARERTQILMDYANKVGGMVLGTGDLSELALGWCTYNGDHMSMYAVNCSIPKTLVRHLVKWFANREFNDQKSLKESLLDIVDTPISPELTPTDKEGKIAQLTEDLVGPYELHDFFLYHMLRRAARPRRIYQLACIAFGEQYSKETIIHWLKTFYRRFFNQQFKRSCLPDGPKVGSVCLSPRGDWRMPSDASSKGWLQELEDIKID